MQPAEKQETATDGRWSIKQSLDYDSAAKSLRVAFANGTGHTYQGVDEATYQAFLNAESVGKFFNQNFKKKG